MGKVATAKEPEVDSHPLLRIVLSKIIVLFHQSAFQAGIYHYGSLIEGPYTL